MSAEVWPVGRHKLNLEGGIGSLEYVNGDGSDHSAIFKSVEEKPAAEGCRVFSGILQEGNQTRCMDLAVIDSSMYLVSPHML